MAQSKSWIYPLKMVDLSSSLCKRLPEGNNFENKIGIESPKWYRCEVVYNQSPNHGNLNGRVEHLNKSLPQNMIIYTLCFYPEKWPITTSTYYFFVDVLRGSRHIKYIPCSKTKQWLLLDLYAAPIRPIKSKCFCGSFSSPKVKQLDVKNGSFISIYNIYNYR